MKRELARVLAEQAFDLGAQAYNEIYYEGGGAGRWQHRQMQKLQDVYEAATTERIELTRLYVAGELAERYAKNELKDDEAGFEYYAGEKIAVVLRFIEGMGL
jgi:hypothetical protein